MTTAANADPRIARLGLHLNFVCGTSRVNKDVLDHTAAMVAQARAAENAGVRLKMFIQISGVDDRGNIAWAYVHGGDSIKGDEDAMRVQGQLHHLARARESMMMGGSSLTVPTAHYVGHVQGEEAPESRPPRTGRDAFMSSLVSSGDTLTYGEYLDAMSSPLDKVRPPGEDILSLRRTLEAADGAEPSGPSVSHLGIGSQQEEHHDRPGLLDDAHPSAQTPAVGALAADPVAGRVGDGRLVASGVAVGAVAADAGAEVGADAADGGAAGAVVAGAVATNGGAEMGTSTKGKGWVRRKSLREAPVVESVNRPAINYPSRKTVDLVLDIMQATHTPITTTRRAYSEIMSCRLSRHQGTTRGRKYCVTDIWPLVAPTPGSVLPFKEQYWSARVMVDNRLLNMTLKRMEHKDPAQSTLVTMKECPVPGDSYATMDTLLGSILMLLENDHAAKVTVDNLLYKVGVAPATLSIRRSTRAKSTRLATPTRQTRLPRLAPAALTAPSLSSAPSSSIPSAGAADAAASASSAPNTEGSALGQSAAPAGLAQAAAPRSGAVAPGEQVTTSASSGVTAGAPAVVSTEGIRVGGAQRPGTTVQGNNAIRRTSLRASAAAARAAARQAAVLRAAQVAAVEDLMPLPKSPSTRKRRGGADAGTAAKRRVSFAAVVDGQQGTPAFTATPPQSSAPEATGPCDLLGGDGQVVARGSVDYGRKVLHGRAVPADLVVVLVSECSESGYMYPHEQAFPIDGVSSSGSCSLLNAKGAYIAWDKSQVRSS